MDDVNKLINKDKQNKLSHTELVELISYNPATGIFTWKVKKGSARPGDVVGNKPTSCGYLRVAINRESYYLHRLAWFYYYKEWPTKYIDHIDGCKTNNAISNLQDISKLENNRKQKNDLGTLGKRCLNIDNRTNKIQVTVRTKYLGQYNSKEEALLVRDKYLEDNNLFIDENGYVKDK
jgi:hypothetical protein